MEEWIDEHSKHLPPLDNFILPGGGKTSAQLHIARAVCRRAERSVQPLVDSKEVDPEVLRYESMNNSSSGRVFNSRPVNQTGTCR